MVYILGIGDNMEKQLITLLQLAIKRQASDIHFNIEQDEISIQFRIRQEIITINEHQCSIRLFRYLQYRANLDVAQNLLPQTGQFEMYINDKQYALRLAVLHSLAKTSAVLRILNTEIKLQIESLTFNKKKINELKRMIKFPAGLILLSGPTGSGKTTTLYTLLNSIEHRKIFTLEDPIEIYSSRYVQLQINEQQNFGYQEGIKQLLRHDPDVIVIGEIRDELAAAMAVRCALTGHLVLATIHAFDTRCAIERMLELKVSKSQLKQVLVMISAQRLYDGKNKKRKIGVYEIMDKENIEHTFKEEALQNFSSLQDEIQEGVRKGYLSLKQTENDIKLS